MRNCKHVLQKRTIGFAADILHTDSTNFLNRRIKKQSGLIKSSRSACIFNIDDTFRRKQKMQTEKPFVKRVRGTVSTCKGYDKGYENGGK